MDTKAIRSTWLSLLLVLGVKGTHKATVDIIPASTDTTAVLQCYTYGIVWPECFPWPHYYEPEDGFDYCTTVWMKDEQILRSDNRFNISSRFTYNFCDTFPETSKLYTQVSGRELPEGGIIDDYDQYNGFGCFVSTLTIKTVQESDFGVYHCNYSDLRPDAWHQPWQHLANVTLVKTTDYTPPEPKVELLVNNYMEGTYEEERLAQCISVGTPLDWYYVLGQADLDTTSCDPESWGYTDLDCRFKRFSTKLSSLVSEDMWRCFEFTNVTHEAYSYDSVYESFLFFKNFCRFDSLYVFCGSADGKIGDTVNVVQINNPTDVSDNTRYHMNYRRENVMKIAAGVGLFIVGSLLIGFSIWACSRITCNRNPAPTSL